MTFAMKTFEWDKKKEIKNSHVRCSPLSSSTLFPSKTREMPA
jgi:hypothetical protein